MKSILLADDDASVRTMVARVLELAGYRVCAASVDGSMLPAVQEANPDLIVFDLKAPLGEAWAMFGQVQRCKPGVPIVLITALSNQEESAARMRVDAIMEKPLDLPRLLTTIESLLAESEPARDRRLRLQDLAAAHAA